MSKKRPARKRAGRGRAARKPKRRLAATAAAKPVPKPSLYERLGGVYAIAAVVDDFVDRLMKDPRLNANPKVDEAHHRVPPAGFKYLVTEQVCWATGGPQKYTGKNMKDAHKGLGVTDADFAALVASLKTALDKNKVGEKEQKELFDLLGPMRKDVVEK